MMQQVEAVYENGVLRPLQPLNLKEASKVVVSISEEALDPRMDDMIDYRLLAYARARTEARAKAGTLSEGRNSLSTMEGSLAELIIAERGEF